MSKNTTFYVKDGSVTFDLHLYEATVKLGLPAGCYLTLGRFQHRNGSALQQIEVSIRDFDDEPEQQFSVELKGVSLTKAGRPDKRESYQGFIYVAKPEDLDVIEAALPDEVTLTLHGPGAPVLVVTRDVIIGKLRAKWAADVEYWGREKAERIATLSSK
jgi:hypothetical protein